MNEQNEKVYDAAFSIENSARSLKSALLGIIIASLAIIAIVIGIVFFCCFGLPQDSPILIVAATEEESNLIKSEIKDAQNETTDEFTFILGRLYDYPVVLSCCQGTEANAAIATAIAIERFNPKSVICEGTAGAHNIKLNIGDLVVGTKVVNEGAFVTSAKNIDEGSNTLVWKNHTDASVFTNSPKYSYNCDTALVDLAMQVNYDKGQVCQGIIGSSDMWNREKDRISYLNKYLGTDCEEMEGFAVACACAPSQTPFIVIRVISNNELIDGLQFDPATQIFCQNFTLELVKLVADSYK